MFSDFMTDPVYLKLLLTNRYLKPLKLLYLPFFRYLVYLPSNRPFPYISATLYITDVGNGMQITVIDFVNT